MLEGEEARKEKDRVVFDLKAIDTAIEKDPQLKLIHIQRSCGYKWRPSIPVLEIGRLCEHIRRKYKEGPRCDHLRGHHGELVEDIEPCHVGADICAGSLIKNLGGTLAPSGLRINFFPPSCYTYIQSKCLTKKNVQKQYRHTWRKDNLGAGGCRSSICSRCRWWCNFWPIQKFISGELAIFVDEVM